MARVVLLSVVLAFLFIQLASSQNACQDAIATLTSNSARCIVVENPRTICSGDCRDFYEAIFDNCAAEVSKLTIAIYSYS